MRKVEVKIFDEAFKNAKSCTETLTNPSDFLDKL